jgi:hypothetical protein
MELEYQDPDWARLHGTASEGTRTTHGRRAGATLNDRRVARRGFNKLADVVRVG